MVPCKLERVNSKKSLATLKNHVAYVKELQDGIGGRRPGR